MARAIPFDHMLQAAAAQPEPLHLLFVFAQGEAPALAPLGCVAKPAHEVRSFDALLHEAPCKSARAIFVGALSGRDGAGPATERIEYALRAMTENIRAGRINGYTMLDPSGAPVRPS